MVVVASVSTDQSDNKWNVTPGTKHAPCYDLQRLITNLLYSPAVAAKLKRPVSAKLKCPNYPSEE